MNSTKNYFETKDMIKDTGDFLDLIGNAGYSGMNCVLIDSKHLTEDFFDLRSGVAGEYLQKLSNYSMRAAIILDEIHLENPRFREMVFEANRSGSIVYFKDRNSAEEWLRA